MFLLTSEGRTMRFAVEIEKAAISGGLLVNAGNHLRSHTLTRAVPSAQRGLTSVFGMGTGVTLAVYSPANLGVLRRLFPLRVCSNNLNPSCNRACRTCCEPDLVREYKLSKNGGRPLIPQQCVARPLRSRGF